MADYTGIGRVADAMRRDAGRVMQRDFEENVTNIEPKATTLDEAAKEVDQERRDVDEVVERMRSRQRYFFEKAQMLHEAASHYERMAEDLAELLNNPFVNKANVSPKEYRS